MDTPNIQTLDTFDLSNIPTLDVAVLGALELFGQTTIPSIELAYKHPLIVGSGNAEATGRIIFHDKDAVFASESSYQEKLENIDSIDGVVLVSASGGKHAPIIAHCASDNDKRVSLITNTDNSAADQELDTMHKPHDEFVFPKNREPYTYNTSTYMGMILGKTGEDPNQIKHYIETVTAKIDWPDFEHIDKYYLIVPAKFAGIIRMLSVKFIELFGRNIAVAVETDEYVRHATTVAKSNELFISFGTENTTWGEPSMRLHVPLPDNAGYGAMMAIGYYTVAQIQKAHSHHFKDNIASYTAEVSEVFGSTIKPIVDK